MRKYWVITEPLRLRALTVSGIKVQNVLREEDADEVLLLGLFTLAGWLDTSIQQEVALVTGDRSVNISINIDQRHLRTDI